MAIYFVRHSQPAISADQERQNWALSAPGQRLAADLGAHMKAVIEGGARPIGVWSSAELKAQETAELLGLGPVTTDERLGEVTKPWYQSADDHQAAVEGYLSGDQHDGWEARADAVARFDAALANIGHRDAVVVTHGTVLALWLGQQIPGFDAVDFWLNLDMPHAYRFDRQAVTVTDCAQE